MASRLINLFILLAGVCCVAGCGGGSGGPTFEEPGYVTLALNKNRIDTGERVSLVAFLSSVHPYGVMLKFRFPSAMTYSDGSSYLRVDGERIEVHPYRNAVSDEVTYLVYFLSQETFGESLSGELHFDLRGKGAVTEGNIIAADLDLDDPEIANTIEFGLGDPRFTVEDQVYIEVLN